MYNEQIESLVKAALADGMLTEKEKQILFKKAQSMGIDLDEFEMVLDARLVELQKAAKEKAEKSAPKSNKVGDIRKCPACGAIVQSYQGVCSECGYAFENVEVNYASKELSNLLMKTNSKEQMSKIIDAFPIPMEKAALIAFATWLAPQSLDIQNPLSKSYQKKYSEVIDKIKLSFPNDKDFISLINQYEKDKKIISRKKIFYWCKENPKWTITIILAPIILTYIIIATYPTPNNNVTKCQKAIQIALNNNDLKKAANLLVDFKRDKRDLKHTAQEVVVKCIENNKISTAKLICNNCWQYASNRRLLFDYYMQHEQFDKAWDFYDRSSYEGKYDFIVEVINYYCSQGKKTEAKKFLKKELQWFVNEVDSELTPEYKKRRPKDYQEALFYKSTNVKSRLTKYIDEY